MNKYMHTINGCPAFFDGEQIVYARSGLALSELFRKSLAQIKKERKASIAYCQSHGFNGFNGFDYGYIRFTE